jgi:hypothetical protein
LGILPPDKPAFNTGLGNPRQGKTVYTFSLLPHAFPVKSNRKSNDNHDDELAFIMEADDRFHSITVSDGVRYESAPDHETILTFFAIKRAGGTFEVVQVMKTFKGNEVVTRNVQTKGNIEPSKIDDEVSAIVTEFGKAIKVITGYQLKWHRLNLSNIIDFVEQVRVIREWGRVGVTDSI